MTQAALRAGEWVDEPGHGLADIDFAELPTRIATDRYLSPAIAAQERVAIWSKVWQVVGRAADLPAVGDWKEYRLLDQSYLVVRGKDNELRGFVNACRHRGNLLCQGSGNAKRGLLCQYHLWSYDLDGRLRGMLREESAGDIDKADNSLLPVRVEVFAGFVFLNPDPAAAPLQDFLGPEVAELLAPYHLDEMTTVMDVSEALDCNWKVVIDAFSEGYHINGIHPELLQVIQIDPAKAKYRFLGDHSVAVAPFEVVNAEYADPEQQVEGIRNLPATFPTVTGVLPRFEELVAEHRAADGTLRFPAGVTARILLQQATRDTLGGMGLDLSGLTDAQMSDNNGWLLFPNFFMTIRAGEAHVVMAVPHPDGDPQRCIWHVTSHMWLPPEHREAFRAQPVEVTEPGSFDYFLALQQDYVQMPRQQRGLRNERLESIVLVPEEVVIAHFHRVLDEHLAGAAVAR